MGIFFLSYGRSLLLPFYLMNCTASPFLCQRRLKSLVFYSSVFCFACSAKYTFPHKGRLRQAEFNNNL